MNLLYHLYYRFNAWRYGKGYGCGRCHHAFWSHHGKTEACTVQDCPCKQYHIGLTYSHDSGEK